MCIVLFTTAHPDYALILIDNRDEYILRPTSRPHWWTHPTSGHRILSSRDLHRRERGTWLGVTSDGLLAVLTNYRESEEDNVQGVKSRGAIVTAWLGGVAESGLADGVHEMVKDGGTKGVGGFSMVCGKLRRKSEGIAIVSNRVAEAAEVPILAQARDETWALSNAVFDPDNEWPKVQSGKQRLQETVEAASKNNASQDSLINNLFSLLDTDTLPPREPRTSFPDYIDKLRHSIFVPPIGDASHQAAMKEAAEQGRVADEDEELLAEEPDPSSLDGSAAAPFETGMYGTQRQTVVLVDWEGNVTFVERALWDANGSRIAKGEGDVMFRFKVDGWEGEG